MLLSYRIKVRAVPDERDIPRVAQELTNRCKLISASKVGTLSTLAVLHIAQPNILSMCNQSLHDLCQVCSCKVNSKTTLDLLLMTAET